MWRYIGKHQMQDGKKKVTAVLWQDTPLGGAQRNFYVYPTSINRYRLMIFVGPVTTTARQDILKREVVNAARTMGIETNDNQWKEIDGLLVRA
jgi:hypothetical protein